MMRFGLTSLLIVMAIIAASITMMVETMQGHTVTVVAAWVLFGATLIWLSYSIGREQKRNRALQTRLREGDEQNTTT